VPRVSVIIPAFNAESHLGDALRSVVGQTYNDWEVVVGDDCSTDATGAIARDFGPSFTVVRTPRNSGPAAARNLAVAHSRGELLALLDADDFWRSDYLEHQVALFDRSGGVEAGAGIVACNARVLGPNGFLPGTYMDYVGFPNELSLAQLLASNPIFVSALVPRAIVDNAGGFCAEIFGTEDHDLWVRIVELGYRVVATREPLAVYRLAAGSVSSSPRSMSRASQAVYRRALERGRLGPRERRIARRELRRHRLVERITSSDGLSYRGVIRSLPSLLLFLAEDPTSWRRLARGGLRGRRGMSPFFVV
jgi:glycosyltransferase involved in cell wall biosynthesis